MFNELLKNVMNLGIITEDDVKRLTAIELMMLIIERINGLLLLVNNVDGKLDSLLEDVNKITIEELNKWTQDGTFDKLINELALKTVNDRIDETNAQLSQVNTVKVGNGVLASMSDLGQDIKEAMVGGSSNIPVVGAGSVNNVNINQKQITPDKCTDTITINVGDLPVYRANSVINPDGSITASSSYHVVEYVMPDEINSVKFVGTETLNPNGFIYYNDESVPKEKIINFVPRCPHRCTIRLNYSSSIPQGVKQLVLKAHTKGQISENEFDVIGADNLYDGTGYIAKNVINRTLTYSVYKVKIRAGFKYKATLAASDGLKGCAYDSTNNYLGNISIDNGYIRKVANMDYVLVNITDGDKVIAEREDSTSKALTGHHISNYLNKPYSFNGKKAYFFGDSITEGFTSGSTKTSNGYPKLFSEKVGLTFSNYGIGGALFTSGYNEIETIPTTIKKKNYSGIDYVFIAGGTNDYGLGASLTQLRTTLVNLCSWLKTNASHAEIIFILPIARVRDADIEVGDLQEYRNIIGEIAIMNGFSVLDGSLFNFPTVEGEYQELVMSDRLHPSEFGYTVYAKDMCTYLC